MKKILVVRFSSIGDVIITTPILKSLRGRYPEAQIDYLTKHQFVCLIQHNPDLDHAIGYNPAVMSLKSLKKQLQAEGYDLLIDLHNSLRTRYLRVGLASTTMVYGKPYLRRWLLTRFGVNLLRHAKPIYQRYYQACSGLGLQEHCNYFVHFSSCDAQSVANYTSGKKPILISLSAAHATKKWSVENFAQLIDKLPDEQIIILGGEKEKQEADDLKKLCVNSDKIIDLSGELNLLQTAALMKNAKLLLCHDSGLLHLAQSQLLPCVAIFGCTTRDLGFFPIRDNCQVVQVELSCRPCTAKGLPDCPRGHFNCMRQIMPDMVLHEVKKLL